MNSGIRCKAEIIQLTAVDVVALSFFILTSIHSLTHTALKRRRDGEALLIGVEINRIINHNTN